MFHQLYSPFPPFGYYNPYFHSPYYPYGGYQYQQQLTKTPFGSSSIHPIFFVPFNVGRCPRATSFTNVKGIY
jgi:hypothetical protein